MRLPTLLLTLPVLALAQQQAPFQAWIDKAKSFIPSALNPPEHEDLPHIPNPVDAGASKVAEREVEKINVRNWQRKLAPSDVDQEWLVFLTGGNKSCFGKCTGVNEAWNLSVPLLTASAKSSSSNSRRLRLGLLDCERDEVLCTAWASGVPVIYHFQIPSRNSPTHNIPLHIVPLNITTTKASDITSIPSSASGGKNRYADFAEYNGIMHPFDGQLAQFGLLQPLGYALWALGHMPGWVMMLGISFVSRQIMAKRMAGSPSIREQARQNVAAAPPPSTGAGSGARPAGGAQGGAKKRR